GIALSNCFSLKTRSDCRSNRTNAVFRGVAIELGRCLQQSRRVSVTDETFGHKLAKSPRGPIQCVIAAVGFPDNNVEGLSNAALITAGPWNETQYFSIKRFRKFSPDRRGHTWGPFKEEGPTLNEREPSTPFLMAPSWPSLIVARSHCGHSAIICGYQIT